MSPAPSSAAPPPKPSGSAPRERIQRESFHLSAQHENGWGTAKRHLLDQHENGCPTFATSLFLWLKVGERKSIPGLPKTQHENACPTFATSLFLPLGSESNNHRAPSVSRSLRKGWETTSVPAPRKPARFSGRKTVAPGASLGMAIIARTPEPTQAGERIVTLPLG
jgi:hypothetical protein